MNNNDIIHSNVLQWKYTHCRYNQNNSPGYYTYAMSKELGKDDENALITFVGTYNKPTNKLKNPLDTELHSFPVAFSSFRLPSGKRAITRTRYVGKCYDNPSNFENFFVHGLILPEGDWNFYPIELCWDDDFILPADMNPPFRIWFDGLKINGEQNINRRPDPLPTVEIRKEHLTHFTFYDFDKLFDTKKLLDETDRFEQFKALFATMQHHKKPILLRDKPKNIATWIAALQYALPVSAAQNITFSTYCNSEEKASRFNVFGTAFEGNDIALDSHCYIGFDFDKSTIPAQQTNAPYLQLLMRDNFPGTNINECWEFAKKHNIEILPFGNIIDDVALLHDFIYARSVADKLSTFDAAWHVYTKLPEGQQRFLIPHILQRNQTLPMTCLSKIVPYFENMIESEESDSDIRELFSTWFVTQFIENLNDHKKEMIVLLKSLKHQTNYAKKFLTLVDTQDRSILDTFLPLFAFEPEFVVGNEERLNVDNQFLQYVIRQFASPLDKHWGDHEYHNYQKCISTVFQSSAWIPYFSLFYRRLSSLSEDNNYWLFRLNFILLTTDYKKAATEMEKITKFAERASPKIRSDFFSLVLNQVFPCTNTPQAKYLLFKNLLSKGESELPDEFVKTHWLDLLKGCEMLSNNR